MATFLSAERIREIAGRAASTVLADEISETLPVATRGPAGVEALVLFYSVVGARGNARAKLPSHAMRIDPKTGSVIRFWACDPAEIGLGGSLTPVPGAGALPDDVKDFLDFRDRFIALSPSVWEAFEKGNTSLVQGERDRVAEYYDLFLKITRPPVAPFYVGAARDFFDWIRAVLGSP
ncbi:MAG: hypothetical protein IPK82_29010 [Polyangiaceae bacterium]|nr:hypothetical protein [Polyangiaceae bacterium]